MQETDGPVDSQPGRKSPLTAQRIATLVVILLAVAFLIWFLAIKVDWGGGGSLPLGQVLKGRVLIVRLDKINRVPEVGIFRDSTTHYVVSPADPENDLVTLQLSVWNDEASISVLNMEGRALEVRGMDSDDRFTMLEVCASQDGLEARDACAEDSPNVRVAAGGIEIDSDRYPYGTGFLAGVIELPQGPGLSGGWTVFEVPKGLEIARVRWGAGGDVIFFPQSGS